MKRSEFKQLIRNVISEEFETTRDVVSNPKYNSRSFDAIINDFKAKGGEILGIGSQGYVLAHPKWKFVMKLFNNDTPYLEFVRFCLKHPRKSFPIFYDKPRRIVPNFERGREWENLYIVKMERLESISKEEYLDVDFYIHYGDVDFSSVPDNHIWRETEKKIRKMEKTHPSLKPFLEDYRFLMQSQIKGTPDITKNNIMKRKNGEFILSDPFWVGETPYQRHDRLTRAEIGDYDDEPAPTIKGGERWKAPKKPKPIKAVPYEKDDTPF